MNNYQHQLVVQEAAKKKFRGHKTLKSKHVPQYPFSAEREFRRITRAYMKAMHESLKDHLPEILGAYKKQRRGDCRFDDARDFEGEMRGTFHEISKEIEQKIYAFGVDAFLAKIASISKSASIRQWKMVVRDTLGIDLLDDYYLGEFYEEALRKWIDSNVTKIKSIPSAALNDMHGIIYDGYIQGKTLREIQKDIQETYKTSRHQAEMLARDQVSSLNAQLTKMQQKDAGCTHYRWSDSRDSRVRDCHRALNGKIFSWDDPPEMWYITKSRGKVYTGRRCHPGEDYCCRCIAIPVFNIDTLNLPMK